VIRLRATAGPALLSLALALTFTAQVQADSFKPFTADTFAAIKQEFAGREFLLGLWSVDCPPCLVELEMMGSILQANPDLPFVLISTDPLQDRESAYEFLEDFGLQDFPSYMFADSFTERLRFSIDPAWFGELPRSYFFDTQHRMQSHSGIMTRELLQDWFQRELKNL
jgi:thiol-disulfide isomerase/thioredoxin